MSDGRFIIELDDPSLGFWGSSPNLKYVLLNSFPNYYESTDRAQATDFAAFSVAQKAYVEDLLDYVSSIINVDFTADTDPSNSELTFGWNSTTDEVSPGVPVAGWTALPGPDEESADIWLNDQVYTGGPSTNFSSYGGVNRTLLHEIGHALGLNHTFEGPDVLPSAELSHKYSIMGNSVPGPYVPVFSLYDIAMLQNQYGARAVNSSDSTYTVTFRGEQYASLPTFFRKRNGRINRFRRR